MKLYKICNKISLLLHALCSAAGYFLIEAISRHSFTDAWTYMTGKPLVFAYNAGLIFTTSLIVYLFRRRTFWRVLVSIFWLLLGIINGVILANRVTPFTGPDLHLLTDGMAVLNKYLPSWGVVVALIVLGVLVLILLSLLVKGPKYQRKVKFRYDLLLVVVGIAAFVGITQLALEKRVLSNYFGNIAFAYEDYGYPYCLGVTIFNTGISCPRDYSEEEIERIEKTEDNLPATNEKNQPNILFLQLESFFDPTLVNYLKISEDPIPTFRKLMKEYSSGYYKVPAVGAGTANTEFESITGMSLHYFGPGEYPYKSILKETTCESAPYVLKNLGYTAHAVHNNEANFYGRRSIFPNLGFDTFTSAEYMKDENQKNPLGWTKDSVLTDEIVKCLDSTEGPDYVYTISVQGHGDYPSEPVLENPEITVSGAPTDELNNKWEYYVNQIHEMDDFVKELTDKLADYPEDVVLVMYGDHLPSLDIEDEDLTYGNKYQTSYFMWDNIGLKKQDGTIEAYDLGSEVLNKCNIHTGIMNSFHQTRKGTKNYQKDMKNLQYDMLYGKQYVWNQQNPYKATNLKFGIRPLTVTKAYETKDSVFIVGNNFTNFCQVYVGDVKINTTYHNEHLLEVSKKDLKNGDTFKVSIVSKTPKVLSSSNEYVYQEKSEK